MIAAYVEETRTFPYYDHPVKGYSFYNAQLEEPVFIGFVRDLGYWKVWYKDFDWDLANSIWYIHRPESPIHYERTVDMLTSIISLFKIAIDPFDRNPHITDFFQKKGLTDYQ